MENGSRGYDIGLNPHSNGVAFCMSLIHFLLINVISNVIIKQIVVIIIMEISIKFIIYFYLKPLSWKLRILSYTK